jgi:dihydrofolate reductase
MRVTLVAAVARNMVIGREGRIPWRLPGEQATFKELTLGHVLVMGRLTYESIGRPLPGRTTVVVTSQRDWQPPGGPRPDVLVEPDLDAALRRAASVDDEVFVVGGGEVYRQAMPRADRLIVSWVDDEPDGDAFFPHVSDVDWSEARAEQRIGYRVTEYVRRRTPTAGPESAAGAEART